MVYSQVTNARDDLINLIRFMKHYLKYFYDPKCREQKRCTW